MLSYSLAKAQDVAPVAPPSPDITAEIQKNVDQHLLAGAVAAATTKEKLLSLTAVGYENLESKKPMATNSLFWIASISKPLTATAFMMLVEEGKVSVDDPVSKYLPEFDHPMFIAPPKGSTAPIPAPHPILIRNLLSHTSGLGFRSPAEAKGLDSIPIDQAVASYAKEQLRFDPGTQFFYSNEGLNTIARLIEVISGEPYEKFMDERLFQPLGMTDTTFWPNEEQLGRLVTTYGQVDTNGVKSLVEKPWPATFTFPLSDHQKRFPFAAGGLFSTATDLAKFGRMILKGGTLDGKKYLSPETIAEMTTDQTGIQKKYGFAWFIFPDHFEHRGVSNTFLGIYPKDGIAAVFLANQNGAFPWSMFYDFEKIAAKEAKTGQP